MKKKKFLSAVDTLKLYRRADLTSESGTNLIKELYVDPLPDDHLLNTILKPNTTYLIGRKGTGKSTLFQRAQTELDEKENTTWAYIDIKSLYESSTSEIVDNIPSKYDDSINKHSVEKILVFRNFATELVTEIKKQIEERSKKSRWKKVKEAFSNNTKTQFSELDQLIEQIRSENFLEITNTYKKESAAAEKTNNKNKASVEINANLSATPSASAKALAEEVSELESTHADNYSKIFIRIFKVREIIKKLINILKNLNIRHLYIFVDDFSELKPADMEQVVDTILSPFNNWSDEFIKLKIAVYPGRRYSGEIDVSKVDEIYLDIYRCYGRNDVTAMETRAIDFTRRLIEKRIEHFCGDSPSVYFRDERDDIWRVLFYSCLGNPRVLGYILYYSYETSIVYGHKIDIASIQKAARRYYEEKIEFYFRSNKFLHETFEERSSIYSLKELYEQIVKKAKELRYYEGSKIFRDLPGRPPTSHFYIVENYDSILSTLELNFFVTKYYEMKDRDGKDVSVYALNYGLCQQQTVAFGRPTEKREQRLYFVERVFDYSPIIASYIKVNQEIICDECQTKHGHEKLPAIQSFDMLCPKCKKGTCRIVNLSRKYEKLINEVDPEILLPSTELGILKTLHDQRETMFANQIAAELDCSYQMVGKRGKFLADKSLVQRTANDKGRRIFEISDLAEQTYFTQTEDDTMDFDLD